ncbi:MAG: hypothetical protein ABII18_00820 [bacterium]|nr:hypothetical protein [bacterium]
MKVMRYLIIVMLISILLGHVSCTKVIAYGAKNQTKPLTQSYSSNVSIAMTQAEKALESLGYRVLRTDESRNRLTTGWVATTSDSHYLEMFKRADYGGSAGSYYQVVCDVYEKGPKVEVSVSTIVKSISGQLKSSKVVERKVVKRVDEFMRSPQIVITNVGMQER